MPTHPTKRLVCFDPKTGKHDVIATFFLEGGAVRVELADPRLRSAFREDIVDFDTVLTPADGKRYFDALDKAYSTSSFYSIETIERD